LAANFGPNAKPRMLKTDTLVRDEAALSEALYTQYRLPPNHGIHDIFPSRARPGLVWTSMTPGVIVGTDTRNPDPATRSKDYPIPDPIGKVASHGIIEERGHVYWTEIAGNHVGELDPTTGTVTRHAVPHTLRADTKGNLWVSYMSSANKIAKLDVVTKQVTEFPATKASNSYGMIVDQKDRVWLSVVSNKGVPMYDTQSGRWKVYETSNSTRRLTVDSKGHVWAAQYYGNAITEIDPDSGRVTDYRLPFKYGDPYDVVAEPADNLWIENTLYNSLVRFDQKTKRFTYVPLPVLNGHTPKLESDDDGTVWFGLSSELTSLRMRGNVPGKK
jgi:virginiamycin B lyase